MTVLIVCLLDIGQYNQCFDFVVIIVFHNVTLFEIGTKLDQFLSLMLSPIFRFFLFFQSQRWLAMSTAAIFWQFASYV